MKILGRLSKEKNYRLNVHAAGGAYIAINAQSAYVESYNGKSIDECDKFFVVAYAGNFQYCIQHFEDAYLSAEEANRIVKELVKKDFVDLDEYDLCFSSVSRFMDIHVCNSWDDYEGEPLPLKVVIVADETNND